jgi:hypothetical protein
MALFLLVIVSDPLYLEMMKAISQTTDRPTIAAVQALYREVEALKNEGASLERHLARPNERLAILGHSRKGQ